MDYQLLLSTYQAQAPQVHGSRQRQLHACLRSAIRHGSLAGGTRLPASRTLAQELGLSRNTVLYAYDQLATEGFVQSNRRGTVVVTLALQAPAARLAPVQRSALSQRAQALQTLPMSELSVAFAPGVPALAEFPVTLWRRLLDRAWRALSPGQLNYGPVAGELALRCAIADHLRAARGAQVEAEQVFITDGTQASLDVCARAFADPGDTAWLENPGYQGAFTAFQAAQLQGVNVPVDENGLAASAQDWLRHPPKLIYVTPSHQYPLGGVLSLTRRLDLLARAKAGAALIIEDDYDSEFRHEGPPLACLQGLAPHAPVVYLGTFSKTMFPALRIGFMVVPQDLVAALTHLLAQSAPRGRTAEQLALAEFIHAGHFSLHLRRMRRLYRERRDALVAALTQQLGDVTRIHGSSAGMHLALQFTHPALDEQRISAALLAQGISAPPLSPYGQGSPTTPWQGLMLGYAQVPAQAMQPLVQRLAAVIQQTLA